MKYWITVEWETDEPLEKPVLEELANVIEVQLDSLVDGTLETLKDPVEYRLLAVRQGGN